MIRFLFIGSEPIGGSYGQERVQREISAIREMAAELSDVEIKFEIIHASLENIAKKLDNFKPNIIHYVGYYYEPNLYLESKQRNLDLVLDDRFIDVLSFARPDCIFLNSPGSGKLASRLVKYSKVTVGMSNVVDWAATKFSVEFYRGLLSGKSVLESFEVAKAVASVDKKDVLIYYIDKKDYELPLFIPSSKTQSSKNNVASMKEVKARGEIKEERVTSDITQVDTVKPSTHLTRDAYTLVDMLGYGLIVHACYTFLIHKDTKPPLCLSIQSPWGGGKTSFMRMLQEKLDPGSSRITTGREQDTKVEPMKDPIEILEGLKKDPSYNIEKSYYSVWFNAWKYHNSEQVWSGLADAIFTQVSEQFGDQKEKFLMDLRCQRIGSDKVESLLTNSKANTWKKNLKSHTKAYIGIGAITAATLALNAISTGTILSDLGQWGAIISIGGGAALGVYDRYKSKNEQQIVNAQLTLSQLLDDPNYSKKLSTEQQVEKDLTNLFRIIKKNSEKEEARLVIFIDDLDRCSPTHITEVLEALNLFISSEFQNAYFVIGMDPEFVSAAVEQSYINVIQRLSPINKNVGMGWKFMNKFIQLPVILPRPEKKNIDMYIQSLLVDKRLKEDNRQPTKTTNEEQLGNIDKETTNEEQLGNIDKEKFLKEQKAAIDKIDETKESYSDQDPKVRKIIIDASKEFPNNPREMKRFLNILRLYYFIREGRKEANLPYPSLDQIRRWIILVMKWPQVAVWLQKGFTNRDNDNPVGERLQGLEENIVQKKSKQETKSIPNNEIVGNDILSWMNDDDLSAFLRNELNIKNRRPEDALSAANEKGLF